MKNKKRNIINYIKDLPVILESGKEQLTLKDVPKCFYEDLKNFCIGRTIHLYENGELIIGRNLYKNWLKKNCTSGLDYDIR